MGLIPKLGFGSSYLISWEVFSSTWVSGFVALGSTCGISTGLFGISVCIGGVWGFFFRLDKNSPIAFLLIIAIVAIIAVKITTPIFRGFDLSFLIVEFISFELSKVSLFILLFKI